MKLLMLNNLRQPKWQQTHVSGSGFWFKYVVGYIIKLYHRQRLKYFYSLQGRSMSSRYSPIMDVMMNTKKNKKDCPQNLDVQKNHDCLN